MKSVKDFYNYLKFKNEFYNLVLTAEEKKELIKYNREQNLTGLKVFCLTVWTFALMAILYFIYITAKNPIIVESSFNNNSFNNIVESKEIIPVTYVEKDNFTIKKAAEYVKTENAERISQVAFQMKEKYDLPLYIIFAIIDTESEFHRNINSRIGKKYGRGLMQVSEICLQDFNDKSGERKRSKDDLYYIGVNMNIGCWYFSRLYNLKMINSYDEAYVAYNVGIGNFTKYKNKYMRNRTLENEKYNALLRFQEKENYYYNKFNGL